MHKNLSRRELLATGGALLISNTLPDSSEQHERSDALPQTTNHEPRATKRVAGITTVYHHNSHADVILSRLFQTETLDGKGRKPDLELVSLYVDQFPANDLSREFAKRYGFRLASSIAEALMLGGESTR